MQPNDQPHPQPGDLDFDRLVIEHQNQIYGFIRSMIFNPDDARDALQDVNIILLRKRQSFQLGTNFKAWAFTIARFECLTYLSRHKKIQWSTLDTGLLDTLADIVEEKSDSIEPRLHALRLCIQSLPKDFNELIQFRYKHRVPLEKVALQKATTVTAIKQKLYRIRNNLKKCIAQKINATNDTENTD